MKRKIIINYRWRRIDGKRVKPAHREALEETAREQINKMMARGFVAGELHDCIHMTPTDPEDGITYIGHWNSNLS